ncbi:MAG: hypothetical protein IPK86_01255 [Neisseriales bacterium]|nr:MAG: hypothetical protein IPK86_01255 [Neisseriales bacterium]
MIQPTEADVISILLMRNELGLGMLLGKHFCNRYAYACSIFSILLLLLLVVHSKPAFAQFGQDDYDYVDYEDLKSKVCARELERFRQKLRNDDIPLVVFLKITRKLIIEKCGSDNYLLINYLSRIIVQAERLEKGEISYEIFRRFRNQEWRRYERKVQQSNEKY